MLVLTRKLGEQISLPQLGLVITVTDLGGGQVGLGFKAPPEVEIWREELFRDRPGKPSEPSPTGSMD